MKRLTLLLFLAACGKDAPPPAPTIGADPHAAHGAPSGYAPTTLDPARARAMGLTTTKIEERDFTKELRTTGVIVLDETRTAHIHPKVRGWIDGIAATFAGKKVRAGEALCSIYSQEVYAAELEYLAILDQTRARVIPPGELAALEKNAQEKLIAAAKRRLALWDVPAGEIDRLERTREARRTFPLLASRSGTVVARQAVDGMFVDPSLELYTISDLGKLWILADVYETDAPHVKVGTHAVIEVQGGDRLETEVSFIPPTLDEATRTMKARFDVDNEDGRFKPGSFATIRMHLPMGRGLGVPDSAVIRTGARAVVFVVHGEHVQPREVTLGPLVAGHFRVESGLRSGEEVATGAQFLLDSETRLRATSGPAGDGGGHVHP
jgi:Cu(I)/Ag(I) efflux system membrane fusion protein